MVPDAFDKLQYEFYTRSWSIELLSKECDETLMICCVCQGSPHTLEETDVPTVTGTARQWRAIRKASAGEEKSGSMCRVATSTRSARSCTGVMESGCCPR